MGFKIDVTLDKERNIESWCMADNNQRLKEWKDRLIEAHKEVSDMFITPKPFLLHSAKGESPRLGHQISRGVFFCHPTRMFLDESRCILVNVPFLQECFKDTGIIDAFNKLEDINEDIVGCVESFMKWSSETGLHCFKVYQRQIMPFSHKIRKPLSYS